MVATGGTINTEGESTVVRSRDRKRARIERNILFPTGVVGERRFEILTVVVGDIRTIIVGCSSIRISES